MNEKYSRQALIPGWNQRKLSEGYVAIVGSNETRALTSFISGGLAAMGVGKILLTGERIGDAGIFGFDGNLKGYLTSLNQDTTVYCNETEFSNQEITKEILSETTSRVPDIIIDVSNTRESQYFCFEYGKNNNILVFIGESSKARFTFLRSIENKKQKDTEKLISLISESEQSEGKLNSSLLASIIMDEVRKILMPLKGDVETRDFLYKNSDVPEYIDKNVLMVGAGAIGTFTGIGIALNGIRNLFVADFDSVEIGNLGSQILYYDFDKVENRKKSNILCSRLKNIAEKYCLQKSNFISLEERINPESIKNLDNIEVILGCVDNMYTRAVLNMLSTHKKIPYIDGGSGKFGCDVFTYIPERTSCLNCQLDGTIKDSIIRGKKEKAKAKKEDGGCLIEPSLIIPNEIAGTLITNRLKKIEKKPIALSFLSGDAISSREIEENCKEGCNAYSLIAEVKKWEEMIL